MKALWFKSKGENKLSQAHMLNKRPFAKVASFDSLKDYDLKMDEDLLQKVDVENMCLVQYNSVKIRLDTLFDSTLEIVDSYFVCNGCGNIYWVNY
jgi:hypothetical protein